MLISCKNKKIYVTNLKHRIDNYKLVGLLKFHKSHKCSSIWSCIRGGETQFQMTKNLN